MKIYVFKQSTMGFDDLTQFGMRFRIERSDKFTVSHLKHILEKSEMKKTDGSQEMNKPLTDDPNER